MKNESGLIPVEFKVVVQPEEIPERVGSIYLPDTVRDNERIRTTKAYVVAVGGNAFEDWKEPIPKVGDLVYVAIGAGIKHEGRDGKEYRIVNDKDIAAIVVE